jgi:hypothetical protein
VVQVSEDAELPNILIFMLCPFHPVIPSSYGRFLYLLAACEKYDMVQALLDSCEGQWQGFSSSDLYRLSNNGRSVDDVDLAL